MLNVVHVTHEAVHKIGGIGSVIEGLVTSPVYSRAVGRTILVCPLFSTAGGVESRLGPGGEVLYSSVDGRTSHQMAGAFREIQQRYHVGLVYGRRLIRDPLSGVEERPEVLLVDVSHAALEPVAILKSGFHRAFGIVSTRYEHIWDYEQWVRLAEPALAAIRALGAASGSEDCVVVAHEFMGMPTALAAKLHPDWGMRTAFYAHEVSPIRRILEDHPGHDVMLYNVLRLARQEHLHVGDVFGDQFGYYRHALVSSSRHLDVTLAVGDSVVDELRFLGPEMARSDIRLAYNGIPAQKITVQDAMASKERLRDYIAGLLGDKPDYVFTHVTRMASSKGLWRDVSLMRHIEREFRRTGETAVLLVLSTEIGGPRRREDILHMERWWDWPVAHREVRPDLSDGEAIFHAGVQAYNARSRNCKILFINQFGFDRQTCGDRMPEDMEFWDIRKGSDVEFGQSTYEPFGIAQLEALSFGSLCVINRVCGCAGFIAHVAAGGECPNVIVADYAASTVEPDAIRSYLELTREARTAFDEQVAARVSAEVLRRLPRTAEQKAAFVGRGYELARRMSWDVVARDYLLPAMRDITLKTRVPVAV